MFLFCDSFDGYVTADFTQKWTSIYNAPAIQAGVGRRSTAALRVDGTTEGVAKTLDPADPTTLVVMFAVTRKDAVTSTGYICSFSNSSNNRQVGIGVNMDNTLFVGRGGGTSNHWLYNTILASSATALALDVTYWVEFKATISSTVGSYTLRINGVEEASGLGVNVAGSGTQEWSQVALGNLGVDCDFDDFILFDQSGTYNNDFIGDMRVDCLRPTAEGNDDDWTPSTGTDNSLNVDDTAPDDDSTYNSAAAADLTDTFVIPNTPVTGAAIRCLQVCVHGKKTDAADCIIAPVIRHSGTNEVGDDAAMSTSYAYSLFPYDTNPGTDLPWVEADFDAAEFGYKRTT